MCVCGSVKNKASDTFQLLWRTTADSQAKKERQSERRLYLSMQLGSKLTKCQRAGVHMHLFTHTVQYILYTIIGSKRRRAAPPLLPSPHVDSLCLVFTHIFPALSASFLISHQKCKLFICLGLEAIPLSSPTRCFIPKRDLLSKINGESKRTARAIFTMTWKRVQQSQNYPNKNHCGFTRRNFF